MSLDSIAPTLKPGPRRTMLYGVPGIGKSTFAAAAPNVVFLPTEDGLADIDCQAFPLAKSFTEVMDNLRSLGGEHDFQHVAVDSLDWLERLIYAEVCDEQNVDDIEKIGYGKGYLFAIAKWSKFFDALKWLQDQKGVGSILIAHAKIERFNDPSLDPYDRYTPKLHKHASALAVEWAQDVLFANYETFTTSKDEGFGKERVKAIGNGARVLKTTARPAHIAKNRLSELPDEIPMVWAEYAQHFTKAA